MKATISYLPSKDKLLLRFRNVKGKPTKEFGPYKLWWNKQGDVYAIAIIPFSEELKEFEEEQDWIQLGGIWKDINITEEESEEFLKMQMTSRVYLEWLSPENDIYDEVFKDEIR